MSKSFSLLKSVLWGVIGVWAVVTVARFAHGLGATTNLSDATPWGLWIAFDVMAGVALAAGGFVLAATVYIFGLERYRRFVRPAILTALLGYVAVAVGLLYDLGLPWNIWHPMVFPQHHSVLFEVAMCVMLYLTVLALEFSPAVLEHPWFAHPTLQTIHRLVKRLTIPLVIAGIVLSTLHQSSLGSLFLIQPFRVHPLWYSPIVYLLFFISAIGLGLMMVALESLLSGWFFGHKIRTDLLSGLGGAASIVLFLYLALRVGDLASRGMLGYAFDGSWQGFLFLFELLVSALLPALLLAFRRIRRSVAGMGVCSGLTVFGVIGYRFDICIVTFVRPDGLPYLPTWMELAVSAGVVAAAALTFIFFVERLNVCQEDPEDHAEPFISPSNDTAGIPEPFSAGIACPRRHSLVAVVTAALAFSLLPSDALYGPRSQASPVSASRTVDGFAVTVADKQERLFILPGLASTRATAADGERTNVEVMLINGNRDERLVPFDHSGHVARRGGDTSCVQCHHQNIPFDRSTSCAHCHRDMYEVSDTFDHTFHASRMGGNASCTQCHVGDPGHKTRGTAKICGECHTEMVVEGSRIPKSEQGLTGFAPGYMDAMHGLCITCHDEMAMETGKPHLARCDTCHRPEIGPVDTAAILTSRSGVVHARDAAHLRTSERPTVSQPADG